ncbi:MAG TPA: hypothetical protein VME18_13460 [Acidobacteriaceae bacterium]|nr:hypothetical protein [Acidobacteriaceae bacterium]
MAGALLWGSGAWAAAATAKNSSATGCGAGQPRFTVMTDSGQLEAAPKENKARIVILQPGESVTSTRQTFPVGLDGRWAGALRDYSWQLFTVAPGIHHVCVSWQSPWTALAAEKTQAVVQTKPGQTYFLELSVAGSGNSVTSFNLFGLGPYEAKYLVKSLPHAMVIPAK